MPYIKIPNYLNSIKIFLKLILNFLLNLSTGKIAIRKTSLILINLIPLS